VEEIIDISTSLKEMQYIYKYISLETSQRNKLLQVKWSIPYPTHLISSTKMCSPKSLHNLQHDEGGNDMAETEKEVIYIIWPSSYDCIKSSGTGSALN
jgi:hypothetical protein